MYGAFSFLQLNCIKEKEGDNDNLHMRKENKYVVFIDVIYML